MATHSQTMYVGGDSYNSTAGGYQIGGNDYCDANASCSLSSSYTLYEDSSIECTFYSATAPSNWLSSWSCYVELYVNGSQFGDYVEVNSSWFGSGSGTNSRTFSIDVSDFLDAVSGTYWGATEIEGGDSVTIKFVGMDSGFVDSSNRCVYLRSATFYSSNAIKEYTLSFDANGGSGAPSSETEEADSSGYATITIPSTVPIRTNYTFLGWSKSSSATYASYQAGDSIDISKDTTLYAVWEQATVKVTYNANGAGSGAVPVDSNNYAVNSTVTVLGNTGGLAKEGYSFAGWSTSASGSVQYSAGDTFTITSAVTLYAVWTEKKNSLYVYDGSSWREGTVYCYNGSTWEEATPSVYTGSEWHE